MPMYRYRCHACGTTFTVLQFDASEAIACEQCTSPRVERVPGVPGLQFKGKGFYVTDNRRSPAKGSPSSGTDPAKPSAASSSQRPSRDRASAEAKVAS